jgi:hypothetical protein
MTQSTKKEQTFFCHTKGLGDATIGRLFCVSTVVHFDIYISRSLNKENKKKGYAFFHQAVAVSFGKSWNLSFKVSGVNTVNMLWYAKHLKKLIHSPL